MVEKFPALQLYFIHSSALHLRSTGLLTLVLVLCQFKRGLTYSNLIPPDCFSGNEPAPQQTHVFFLFCPTVFQVMVQPHNRHMSFSVYITALSLSDTICLLNSKFFYNSEYFMVLSKQ